MLKRTAATALALTFLAAGAFAFAPGANSQQQAADFKPAAMTTIEKNQNWPLKGRITMDPCGMQSCLEV